MKTMTHIIGLDSGDQITIASDGHTSEIQLQIFDKATKELKTQVVTWLSPEDIDQVAQSLYKAKFHMK